MKTPEERYMCDASFRQLVDTMEAMVRHARFTPSEMREAAMLASIHYELTHASVMYAPQPSDESSREEK